MWRLHHRHVWHFVQCQSHHCCPTGGKLCTRVEVEGEREMRQKNGFLHLFLRGGQWRDPCAVGVLPSGLDRDHTQKPICNTNRSFIKQQREPELVRNSSKQLCRSDFKRKKKGGGGEVCVNELESVGTFWLDKLVGLAKWGLWWLNLDILIARPRWSSSGMILA